MDSYRASKILESINTGPSSGKRKVQHHRIVKNRPTSDNKTIKYFQSISRRRLKEPELVPYKGSYLPYNKEALLERIQTFKFSNWTIQSLKLTPLIIARHGWTCHNMNELRCSCCSARLLIKLPQDLEEEDEEEILDKVFDKYLQELVDGHKGYCPWRKQNTPDNVYEINDFKDLDAIKDLYEANKKVDVQIKIESVLEETEVKFIRKWCDINGLEWGVIMECSLFGWKFVKIGNRTLLQNDSCGRRVMIDKDITVNLLDEHQEWCCFVKGYKKLIEMMRSINKVDRIEDESSVENTLERLDNLRKLYFD